MVLMMNLYNDHDYLDHSDAGRGHYILMLRELGNQNIMIYKYETQTGCVASRRLERVDDRGVQPQIDRHSQRFVDQVDHDDDHGNDDDPDDIIFPKNHSQSKLYLLE